VRGFRHYFFPAQPSPRLRLTRLCPPQPLAAASGTGPLQTEIHACRLALVREPLAFPPTPPTGPPRPVAIATHGGWVCVSAKCCLLGLVWLTEWCPPFPKVSHRPATHTSFWVRCLTCICRVLYDPSSGGRGGGLRKHPGMLYALHALLTRVKFALLDIFSIRDKSLSHPIPRDASPAEPFPRHRHRRPPGLRPCPPGASQYPGMPPENTTYSNMCVNNESLLTDTSEAPVSHTSDFRDAA